MNSVRALVSSTIRPQARPCCSLCSTSSSPVATPEVQAPASDLRTSLGASSAGSYGRKVVHQRLGLQRDVCPRCGGSGRLVCHACGSVRKQLPRGGFHPRNPVSAARLVGSKWTAMERTLGWRHFHVTDKRRAAGETYVCMASTCDSSVRLWLNAGILKSRAAWAPGWLQKEEIAAAAKGAEQGAAECRVCAGEGSTRCMLCNSGGAVIQL